jgi:hypothetical protein
MKCLRVVATVVQNILTPGSRGDRTDVPDVAILITSSQSNNVSRTMDEARNSRLAGERLVVIGVGEWLNIVELNAIASYPYQNEMLRVGGGYWNLPLIRDRLHDIICSSTYIDTVATVRYVTLILKSYSYKAMHTYTAAAFEIKN